MADLHDFSDDGLTKENVKELNEFHNVTYNMGHASINAKKKLVLFLDNMEASVYLTSIIDYNKHKMTPDPLKLYFYDFKLRTGLDSTAQAEAAEFLQDFKLLKFTHRGFYLYCEPNYKNISKLLTETESYRFSDYMDEDTVEKLREAWRELFTAQCEEGE